MTDIAGLKQCETFPYSVSMQVTTDLYIGIALFSKVLTKSIYLLDGYKVSSVLKNSVIKRAKLGVPWKSRFLPLILQNCAFE